MVVILDKRSLAFKLAQTLQKNDMLQQNKQVVKCFKRRSCSSVGRSRKTATVSSAVANHAFLNNYCQV